MAKQTFEILIAGIDYSDYIVYPVSIANKNLDESLNLAELTLSRMILAEPFKPNRQVELRVFEDNVLHSTYFLLLLNDVVEKLGVTKYYKHKLSLIEYTHILEQTVLPDMTITRIEGTYEPTLWDVANKILKVANLTNITVETNAALEAKSPEWTFTRMTVLEALRLVYSMARLVPTMTTFDVLGSVGVDNTPQAPILDFASKTEAYDPQTYKTALYSNVENFIAGENDTITEPSNGWLTVRSDSEFEISADHALIPTSRPIYKLIDVRYNLKLYYVVEVTEIVKTYTELPKDIIPNHYFKDDLVLWNDSIYEKSLYDMKENTADGKGSSLYYKQGEPNIVGLTNIPQGRGFWDPQMQAWVRIWRNKKKLWENTELPIWERLNHFIKPEYLEEVRTTLANAGFVERQKTGDNAGFDIKRDEQENIFNLEFRIKYVPYINTNIYTYRERHDGDDEIITQQYYNQSATVISHDVLGELHDKVIRRGSGSGVDHALLHKSWADTPTVGKRIGEYIVTSADHVISREGIRSTYNVDKYFAKLQKYVAVLEKYRQFSIPNEDIVNRQVTINEFAKFSNTKRTNTSHFVDLNAYIGSAENEINLIRLNSSGYGYKDITLPTTNFAFNNSMIWEASLESNAVAGYKSVEIDSNKRRNEPVVYTNLNGRLGGANITFHTGYNKAEFNKDSANALPEYYAVDAALWRYNNYMFEKDSRERLSFSLQLHHVDTTGKVYLNKHFAAANGLIGGSGLNNRLYFAFSRNKLHGQSKMSAADKISTSVATFSHVDGSIILPRRQLTSNITAQAYAIIDGESNILYWVDEEVTTGSSPEQLYINFSNNY